MVLENFLKIHSTGQKVPLSFAKVPVFIEKEWTCSSIASLAKNNNMTGKYKWDEAFGGKTK